MTNDDLKRFYETNAEPDRKKDFVRYGEDGSIITKHNATKNDEVVNYQTLIKHAGGSLYRHNIRIYFNNSAWSQKGYFIFDIYNDSATEITSADLSQYISEGIFVTGYTDITDKACLLISADSTWFHYDVSDYDNTSSGYTMLLNDISIAERTFRIL